MERKLSNVLEVPLMRSKRTVFSAMCCTKWVGNMVGICETSLLAAEIFQVETRVHKVLHVKRTDPRAEISAVAKWME